MTTYRLFPSTNGPASPISYTGAFTAGVGFAAKGGGNWFQGYWLWVCASGQSTAPVKCALWQVCQNTGPLFPGPMVNTLVPGSVVTSGTLTAGAWNFIPLPEPIQLAPSYDPDNSIYGSLYVAAIGINGSFPYTASSFNSGDTYAAGIVNGPLVGYSGTTGSRPAPYGFAQGLFSSTVSDPTSAPPVTGDGSPSDGASNFWVDVQVSDTVPAGYSGTYRLWPNKFDANAYTIIDAAVAYVVGTEIDLSQSCELKYIHYFVPPSSPTAVQGLATAADVWDISAQAAVASLSSPSWTTESGGAVTLSTAGQWVKAAFPAGTVLQLGKYRVSVYNASGASGPGWNGKDASTGYFTTGAAGTGITWGPLTAPDQATAQPASYYPGTGTGTTGGQVPFAFSGSNVFPSFTTGSNPAQVYWVDLEVTPVAAAVPTPGTFTVSDRAAGGPVTAITAAPGAFTAVTRAAGGPS